MIHLRALVCAALLAYAAFAQPNFNRVPPHLSHLFTPKPEPEPGAKIELHFSCNCSDGNKTEEVVDLDGAHQEQGQPDLETMLSDFGLDCECKAMHIEGVAHIDMPVPLHRLSNSNPSPPESPPDLHFMEFDES